MANYFFPPSSFRIINPKTISGERAQKKCRKWNQLVRQRNRLIKEGKLEDAKQLEQMILKAFE